MLPEIDSLLVLIVVGGIVAAALARRFEQIESARLARGYLVAVTVLMGVRVAAFVAARLFGVTAVRFASNGPYDLTNLLVGGLVGVAAVHTRHGGFGAFLREPDVLQALRLATGVAFVLAGLGSVFFMDAAGRDPFVDIGYTHAFHLFIITAEIFGGAALLLPWRWLTLVVAAGLTIDMCGALFTGVRAGDPLDAAAIAMLLRLAPLALLSARGRWAAVTVGAVVCAAVAIVGGTRLLHRSSAYDPSLHGQQRTNPRQSSAVAFGRNANGLAPRDGFYRAAPPEPATRRSGAHRH